MIFMLTPWFSQIEAVARGEFVLRALGGALGIVGAIASLVIWFGMATFCILKDRSSARVKVWWFVLFLTSAMFGTTAYFFAVYKKQAQVADALS